MFIKEHMGSTVIRDLELGALLIREMNVNILFFDVPFGRQGNAPFHLLHHVFETKSDNV